MKFSDIVKFDSDSPREPGIIKGDFQGDMIDPETLEKAVYDYVEESRDGGEMHKRLGVATLIESIVFTKEKISANLFIIRTKEGKPPNQSDLPSQKFG